MQATNGSACSPLSSHCYDGHRIEDDVRSPVCNGLAAHWLFTSNGSDVECTQTILSTAGGREAVFGVTQQTSVGTDTRKICCRKRMALDTRESSAHTFLLMRWSVRWSGWSPSSERWRNYSLRKREAAPNYVPGRERMNTALPGTIPDISR